MKRALGLSPAIASLYLDRLKAGISNRALTTATSPHYICTYRRFKDHCELNVEWGKEAFRLSDANSRRAKSENHARRRGTLCTKGLHPMTGDNVRWQSFRSRRYRRCAACRRAHLAQAPAAPMPEEQKEAVKSLLASKAATIRQICQGLPLGGGPRNAKLYFVSSRLFYHARATDPAFDKFIRDSISDNNSRGQKIRFGRARARLARQKSQQDAADYFLVQSMVPAGFPAQDKFDVVNDVMLDLHTGRITRDQLRERLRFYIKEANKAFGAKYRKFGDAQLLSLDAPMFFDCERSRIETISEGLWQADETPELDLRGS